MKLTFGFSPCPNDTFMFDAIYNKRIDLEGLDITCIMEDVEFLNKAAFKNNFDITKISFNAFTKLTETYQLLHSGSALGRNCGPLLISKKPPDEIEVSSATIAIPGVHTTANFLLSYAYPNALNKKAFLFSEIEDLVSSNAADLGLIIHENRFTYRDKGLHKVIDLGEYWEQETGLPIPLGGIAVKRILPDEIKSKVDRIIARSVAFAFANRSASENFIKAHAQEMSSDVIASHIDLYVNDFSLNINDEGKEAVYNLFKVINKGSFKKTGIFL